MAKHAEDDPGIERKTASAKELFSGDFKTTAVSHAGRACRLAAPAAKTGIEVLEQSGVVGIDFPPLERTHEHDSSARTVPFVSRD
jgi:hypothetical protein